MEAIGLGTDSACHKSRRRLVNGLKGLTSRKGRLMKILLTGATGVIGRAAMPYLVAAGHDVTAVYRSDDDRSWLEEAGARPLAASLFDSEAVRRAGVSRSRRLGGSAFRSQGRSSTRPMKTVRSTLIRSRPMSCPHSYVFSSLGSGAASNNSSPVMAAM